MDVPFPFPLESAILRCRSRGPLLVINAHIDYNVSMAVLNIRNLSEKVHARLRIRAARAGRSMEAEARAIITEACEDREEQVQPDALQELVDRIYAGGRPKDVVDDLIRQRRREASSE